MEVFTEEVCNQKQN